MNESTTEGVTGELALITDLLRCPDCRGELAETKVGFSCAACAAEYPVDRGVVRFERFGGSETWSGEKSKKTSESYQRQYNLEGRAANYNEKYRRKLFKRLSTQREYKLLRRLLGKMGSSKTILDLPCGGGRLSGHIAPSTSMLLECDVSIGQVLHASETVEDDTPRVFMTGSAFHIPLHDGAVDGVVCVRLCHHLPTAAERERLVRELLRVSRRFVIMTFFDVNSVKNLMRRARAKFTKKRPKKTMSMRQVAKLAREEGATLVTAPHLAWVGSGHRYALLVKER